MRTILLKLIISASVTASSFCCYASFKAFEAPVDESRWIYDGTPLSCHLNHNIPSYGDAEFKKIAGKGEKLAFNLGYKRHQIAANKSASVRAIAPSWQPLQTSREMGEVNLQPGKYIISSQDIASWRLLNELEIGRFPTFFYQDFNQVQDQVSVALSSVGFQAEYDKFLDCLANLVPYKLKELTRLTLFFDFDKSFIRSPYRSKLQALAQYIKHDPSIEVVLISGYTDSKGSRGYNQKLSERRVNSVKTALSLVGVETERFKIRAYGEKNPAASNRTAKGRAKNRRVYIRIAQN
ncbi:flagellar protein MotY [Aliikangiella coralliicola]|uniref:OmpA family protein n=1 Tax=Aliikangiella coralliicola TaxID=2592383 RepID=A0A545U633_9GAMM|nr:OmpA family protein [Aliikangiella coralliicola]TQV84884.1 OmpA family protein [Aliikangiella coralliicola]